MPIVTEAGGTFTDRSGQVDPAGGSAIATNGTLHEDILARLGTGTYIAGMSD
jgi:histidinol-phosphatase